MGDRKSRDQVIEILFNNRKNSKNPEFKKKDRYCREQILVNNRKVFAFQYFDPLQSQQSIFYSFVVTDSKGYKAYTISLGSYEHTNQIDRELGNLKEDERLYHLDGYFPSRHQTYGFFNRKQPPTYEEIRPMILKIIGKIENSN